MKKRLQKALENFLCSPSLEAAKADVWARIQALLRGGDGGHQPLLAEEFIMRFKPEPTTDTGEETFAQSIFGMMQKEQTELKPIDQAATVAAWHLLLNFYFSYSSRKETPEFPSPCDYEVHVPLAQESNAATQFFVLRKGAREGQRTPFLKYYLMHEAPSSTSDHPKILSGRSEEDVHEKDIVEHKIGKVSYGIAKLTSQKLLKLPCYNVAFQLAYDMAEKAVGDFKLDMDQLWIETLKKGESKKTLKLKLLDLTHFHAVLNWPSWEAWNRSERERLDELRSILHSVGETCRYGDSQHESLRLYCHNLFNDKKVDKKTSRGPKSQR